MRHVSNDPSRDDILAFIKSTDGKLGKREIAKHFNIKGSERIGLKKTLRDLAAEGLIASDKLSGMRLAGDLPAVCMISIYGRDREGGFLARPIQSDTPITPFSKQSPDDSSSATSSDLPSIHVREVNKKGTRLPRLNIGDRALARLNKSHDGSYSARIIKRFESETSKRIIGRVTMNARGAMLIPANRRERYDYTLEHNVSLNHNDLIIAEKIESKRYGPQKAKWIETIGAADDPHAFSLLAIAEQDIPIDFSAETLAEIKNIQEPDNTNRTDLTHIPFATIDPADARDHDDAVFVQSEGDGFNVWVAIADVAAYVRPGSALDADARQRGNSTYMPDRVVPMLPEILSTDLCSLKSGEKRPALVLSFYIDAHGRRGAHKFYRANICIAQGYSYEQAQDVFNKSDGPDASAISEDDAPLVTLWQAYKAMAQARNERGPLDLNRPERKVRLDDQGKVAEIYMPPRLEAHRLIEEMMVAANVCAAATLIQKKVPVIFRIHDSPSLERVNNFASFVRPFGIKFDLGQPVLPRMFNRVLSQDISGDKSEMVSEAVLRTQAQASYNTDNIGHFGLSLAHYAHFTSPIRRYADLIVHRALISALGFGPDGLSPADIDRMRDTAESISMSERRSMIAERTASERYLSSYMSHRIGEVFDGQITGMSRAGIFVRLSETGAEGLVPASNLGSERFDVDENGFTMRGLKTGLTFQLGAPVRVALKETMPLKGGLLFSLREGGDLAPHALRKKEKAKPPKGSKGKVKAKLKTQAKVKSKSKNTKRDKRT